MEGKGAVIGNRRRNTLEKLYRVRTKASPQCDRFPFLRRSGSWLRPPNDPGPPLGDGKFNTTNVHASRVSLGRPNLGGINPCCVTPICAARARVRFWPFVVVVVVVVVTYATIRAGTGWAERRVSRIFEHRKNTRARPGRVEKNVVVESTDSNDVERRSYVRPTVSRLRSSTRLCRRA